MGKKREPTPAQLEGLKKARAVLARKRRKKQKEKKNKD